MRSDCYIWPGGKRRNDGGHGMVRSHGLRKTLYVHRIVYEATFGPIPDGLFVRHKCDNPPCINPWHLELGTHQDNMLDLRDRGIYGGLTQAQRWEIVRLRDEGVRVVDVAKEFGIHPTSVSRIVTRMKNPKPLEDERT